MRFSQVKPMPPQNCRQVSDTSRLVRPDLSLHMVASSSTSWPLTYSSQARYSSARRDSTSVASSPILNWNHCISDSRLSNILRCCAYSMVRSISLRSPPELLAAANMRSSWNCCIW